MSSSNSSSSSSSSDSSSSSSSSEDEDEMENEREMISTTTKLEKAKSNANRTLPSAPSEYIDESMYTTILLMYQYVEPMWTKKEHKLARKTVIELAAKHHITGRGRCAREGLICTLTG